MLASYTLLSLSSNFLFSTYTYQNKIKRSEFVTNLLILFLSLLLIRVFFSFLVFLFCLFFFLKQFVKTRFSTQKSHLKNLFNVSVMRCFIQTWICDVMFSLNRILRMKNYSVNIWRRFKTVGSVYRMNSMFKNFDVFRGVPGFIPVICVLFPQK